MTRRCGPHHALLKLLMATGFRLPVPEFVYCGSLRLRNLGLDHHGCKLSRSRVRPCQRPLLFHQSIRNRDSPENKKATSNGWLVVFGCDYPSKFYRTALTDWAFNRLSRGENLSRFCKSSANIIRTSTLLCKFFLFFLPHAAQSTTNRNPRPRYAVINVVQQLAPILSVRQLSQPGALAGLASLCR